MVLVTNPDGSTVNVPERYLNQYLSANRAVVGQRSYTPPPPPKRKSSPPPSEEKRMTAAEKIAEKKRRREEEGVFYRVSGQGEKTFEELSPKEQRAVLRNVNPVSLAQQGILAPSENVFFKTRDVTKAKQGEGDSTVRFARSQTLESNFKNYILSGNTEGINRYLAEIAEKEGPRAAVRAREELIAMGVEHTSLELARRSGGTGARQQRLEKESEQRRSARILEQGQKGLNLQVFGPQVRGELGATFDTRKDVPKYSKTGMWTVTYQGKERQFKTEQAADEFMRRVNQNVGGWTVTYEGKTQTFATEQEANRFIESINNKQHLGELKGQPVQGPVKPDDVITPLFMEDLFVPKETQFNKAVEQSYEWLEKQQSDKRINWLVGAPAGVARQGLGIVSSIVNLTEEYVDPKIPQFVDGKWTRKPLRETKPIDLKAPTADQAIFPYDFEKWKFKSTEQITNDSTEYIKKYGVGSFVAENVFAYYPGGKAIQSVSKLTSPLLLEQSARLGAKSLTVRAGGKSWELISKTKEGFSLGKPKFKEIILSPESKTEVQRGIKLAADNLAYEQRILTNPKNLAKVQGITKEGIERGTIIKNIITLGTGTKDKAIRKSFGDKPFEHLTESETTSLFKTFKKQQSLFNIKSPRLSPIEGSTSQNPFVLPEYLRPSGDFDFHVKAFQTAKKQLLRTSKELVPEGKRKFIPKSVFTETQKGNKLYLKEKGKYEKVGEFLSEEDIDEGIEQVIKGNTIFGKKIPTETKKIAGLKTYTLQRQFVKKGESLFSLQEGGKLEPFKPRLAKDVSDFYGIGKTKVANLLKQGKTERAKLLDIELEKLKKSYSKDVNIEEFFKVKTPEPMRATIQPSRIQTNIPKLISGGKKSTPLLTSLREKEQPQIKQRSLIYNKSKSSITPSTVSKSSVILKSNISSIPSIVSRPSAVSKTSIVSRPSITYKTPSKPSKSIISKTGSLSPPSRSAPSKSSQYKSLLAPPSRSAPSKSSSFSPPSFSPPSRRLPFKSPPTLSSPKRSPPSLSPPSGSSSPSLSPPSLSPPSKKPPVAFFNFELKEKRKRGKKGKGKPREDFLGSTYESSVLGFRNKELDITYKKKSISRLLGEEKIKFKRTEFKPRGKSSLSKGKAKKLKDNYSITGKSKVKLF